MTAALALPPRFRRAEVVDVFVGPADIAVLGLDGAGDVLGRFGQSGFGGDFVGIVEGFVRLLRAVCN